MTAYAALASLMNNIEQMMNHPHLSNSLDNKQTDLLLEKAGLLLEFIEGYNYGAVMSKEVEDLERRIACAAHEAEDVVESHIVDQIHATTICSLNLQQIIQNMDFVVEKAMEVKEHGGSREEQPTHTRPLVEIKKTTAVVGLDAELTQLRYELTGHQTNRYIIPIVGMGGMGKTTLAKNIYEDPLIMEHFDIRTWATVSQQYNANDILSQLLSSLGKMTNGTVDDLGERLHKTLYGRRYLIILDDIWSIKAWDAVRFFFPDDANSSRVILTTRESKVASSVGGSNVKMNLLDEDTSWKLFCGKALFPHKDDPLQLEDVGKEIVRSCKGLALSIVVIGGLLLKSPRTVEFWEDVAKNIRSNPKTKEKEESLDILSLSYNHLPPHLKPCFLYMGVFKEDVEISVSNIVRLWVAEGFIRPKGTLVLEEIAEIYVHDLIDRNLILVGMQRHNGKIGSFRIHDLLRDLCVKVAEQQEFFHMINDGSGVRGTERRLVCDWFQLPIAPPLARTILAGRNHTHPHRYKVLRVLHEDSYESPTKTYENVNLRYLAHRQPYNDEPMWELPPSISLIWNLQTLIIDEHLSSAPIVAAPTEIWEMRQLRHVECGRIYLPNPPPSNERGGKLLLKNMETLARVVNLKLCEDVCGRIPNIKRLDVVYDSDMHGYDDLLMDFLCNLDRLDKLESLIIVVKGSKWPLAEHGLNEKLAFPGLLNELSLSYCSLHWEDLRMIGSLRQLQVLNLQSYSVTEGTKWSPVYGQFLNLKVLKIEECYLHYWDADSSHFPALEKLILVCLSYLKEIPLDIGEISTLELIRVECCSHSAAISAIRIKEDQLENQGNDALQIQLQVFDFKMESFKKMVETQGLTLNHIQFEIR